jgi:TolA-binding protein
LAFRFLSPNYGNQLQFTPDMKKLFVLLMLISFAMICSCQKQDSAAEQQLAQRKTELDAREKALDEKEKALAERERATTIARPILPRTISPNVQSPGQVRDAGQPKIDPAQVKAERDRRLQQLPPDIKAIMPDPSRMNAERDARMQDRLAERQRRLEELQRMRSGAAAPPAAQASTPPSLAASPAAEATSPSPSPTPQ